MTLPGEDEDDSIQKEEAIFDLVKRRYDFELQRVKDLDGKAASFIGHNCEYD